jgi:Lrp/AsnC family transcriptional regulator, leucine-responsive regulatory protein
MDQKDEKLLMLLRRNARQSLVALARDVNLSRSATQDRLSRLQASGAITGFTILEAGASSAQVTHLLLKLDAGKTCAMVVPKLRRIPALRQIHSIAGQHDIMLRVESPSIADIEAVRNEIALTPGVSEVSTMIVLERHLG